MSELLPSKNSERNIKNEESNHEVNFEAVFIKEERTDDDESKDTIEDNSLTDVSKVMTPRLSKEIISDVKSGSDISEGNSIQTKTTVIHVGERSSSDLARDLRIAVKKFAIEKKVRDTEKEDIAPYLCEVVDQNESEDKTDQSLEEKPFHCSECPKKFARQSSLKLHLRTHSGERPYECAECLKRFSQVSNLKKHELTHFGIKPFQCQQCLKNFANRQNLKVHERIHSDNKPYQCNECYKAFSQMSNLKHHMLSHTGEKPFQCEECSKQFTQISNLKQHLQTHSGAKPYECKECFKKFSRITHLKQHMLTHTGERPFECTICSRKFSQHSILKRHVQTHTGEKTHECKECGKKFTRGFALNKHIATHYGNTSKTHIEEDQTQYSITITQNEKIQPDKFSIEKQMAQFNKQYQILTGETDITSQFTQLQEKLLEITQNCPKNNSGALDYSSVGKIDAAAHSSTNYYT